MVSGEEMSHVLPRKEGWLRGAEEDEAQSTLPQDMVCPSREGAGSCGFVIQEETSRQSVWSSPSLLSLTAH